MQEGFQRNDRMVAPCGLRNSYGFLTQFLQPGSTQGRMPITEGVPARPERGVHCGMGISDLRKSYRVGVLERSSLDDDPLRQFLFWLEDAHATGLEEPNAMTLATADASGRVSARMLLLKGIEDGGFVFYSSYLGRKARDLAENPRAALVFYWESLERQVRVEGTVARLSEAASDAYFRSRPRGSRLGAWASRQSEVIAGREVLAESLQEAMARFGEGEVPRPEAWGGYRLEPEMVEFWQGRENRMHDRFRYLRRSDSWRIERLSP